MRGIGSVRVYRRTARSLAAYWGGSPSVMLARMTAARVFHGRGPREFDDLLFAVKPARTWKDYLFNEERRRLQEACAPPQARSLEEDKARFWLRGLEADLPVIPLTALLLARPDPTQPVRVPVATDGEAVRALLGDRVGFEGFAKPVGAGRGYGAFTFQVTDQGVSTAEGPQSFDAFFHGCTTSIHGGAGYLLQPRARVHEDLRPVMPGPGLGTIRILSFRDARGQVRMPWAVMKAPGPGQVVCNPRLGALIVPVDMASGRLGTAFGPTADVPVIHPVERHPETNARFDDVTVPGWQEILAAVERGAHAFPELPCLGWDVAVTDGGPLLLETNWAFGTANQQTVAGRGLRRELLAEFTRCCPGRA
jgi:hypothetical protein